MTKKEFLSKYAYAPACAGDCHQITWDFIEKMEETFDNEDITLEVAVGATYYDVIVLLEVMREDLPDFRFLEMIKKDLESMTQSGESPRPVGSHD